MQINKILAVLLLAIFATFFANRNSLAQQNPTYNRAYQDYVFASDNYKANEDVFQLKRSEYLKFGTLSAKRDAETATKEFLTARDEVVATYLTAIRAKLAETEGVSQDRRNEQYSKIDVEVLWHQDHKDKVVKTSDLNTFVGLSEEAKTRFTDTELVAYQTLQLISEGKMNVLNLEAEGLIEDTNAVITRVELEGDKNTGVVKRWIGDADNQITKSKDNINTANELLLKFKPRDKSASKRSKFWSVINTMNTSLGNTKEALRFLGEIITEIKTAD